MNWKEQLLDLKGFFKGRKGTFWIIAIIIMLTYGFLVFNFSFSIDTEDIIEKQGTFYYGWMGINRYGLVLTKWIFGVFSIIPGYAVFLMIIVTFLYSIFWSYIYYYLGGNENGIYWIFPVIFFTSVNVLELVNFQCLSFEVAFAMLLCALAILCEWRWILKVGGRKDLVACIILSIWCFGSYQAFVPLFISASLAGFILAYNRYEYRGWKDNLIISLKLIAVFLFSYLLYNVIGMIIRGVLNIDAGTYTENMIQWGEVPIYQTFKVILKYIVDVILARNIFGNYGYLCVCVGMIFFATLKLKEKYQENKTSLFFSLIILVFLCSPFMLPLVLGSAPVARGQLALPFVVAFGAQFLFEYWINKLCSNYTIKVISIILLMIIIFRESVAKDNRLLYSDYVVRQQEKTLTENIINRIEGLDTEKEIKSVVIIGNWCPQYNPSMIRGETLGWSFYEWDANVEGGTERRVINYWRSLGYQYNIPSIEERESAKFEAESMPTWPKKGSVQNFNNVVIVKLSE